MGKTRPCRSGWKIAIGILAAVIAAAALAALLVPMSGAQKPAGVFWLDTALDIPKSAPDGTRYVVNNSVATFRLDVAPDGPHNGGLFRDYAAALRYCREHGLASIPSVQLVQGKCKQFDDGLCAALETAVQRGLPGQRRLSKGQALARLLDRLLRRAAEVSPAQKPIIESAAIHVATALSLGGAQPDLPAGLAARVRAAKDRFLSQPGQSRPIGFWTWSEELGRLFQQDRYLSAGFKIADDAPVCLALVAAISGDAELSEAFRRLRDLAAKLTNPPTHVDVDLAFAEPAPCVSFGAIAELLPPAASMADALAAETVEKVRAALRQRFGKEAGFALVSYSRSKEYDLLYALHREGLFTGSEDTMQLIIDAVRSGRLLLEPKPDSGWYDYQWHALETLLVPERARESVKLFLSEAYRARLTEAFRTSLTKHRETHIKSLPIMTLGVSEPAPKLPTVQVGPEFSAEPTPTVYLRYARAYRFLRNALHGVVGKEFLAGIHRHNEDATPVPDDLDAELRRMALLTYGLYDRLCLEIGQVPRYLPDEMAPGDVPAARAEAQGWLSSLEEDPDLGSDTRVAVPIGYYPDGPVRYWATAGIRLQRVVYKYRDEPRVSGPVEPEFVPTYYYLPSDVFLSFDRAGEAPLTRDEFRRLCGEQGDLWSLRKALGAAAPQQQGERLPSWTPAAFVLLAALMVLACRYRRVLGILTKRRVRRAIGIGALVAACAWTAALVISPAFRTRMLVKYASRLSTNLGCAIEARRVWRDHPREQVEVLVDLLSDPSPQVRYLAARFLDTACSYDEEAQRALPHIPEIERRLHAAAQDESPQIAEHAIWTLGLLPSDENVSFLIGRLKAGTHVDSICWSALGALARIGNPRALDAVLPFTHDPRALVRSRAIESLGGYRDGRAARRLAELVRSGDQRASSSAASGIAQALYSQPHPPWEDELNAALLAAAGSAGLSPDQRARVAELITKPEPKVRAWLAILESPSSDDETSVAQCRTRAVRNLGDLGSAAGPAVGALTDATRDPDPMVRQAAAEALKRIR